MADNGGAAFDPPCAPWRALVNLTGTPLTIVHSDSGAETYLASSGFAQVTCNKACVGVVHGVQAVYPGMVARGSGHIVNTASMAGLAPAPLLTPYAMTKHAVVGLSVSLRAEAAAYGVRVSALCPSAIETPILDSTGPADLPKPKWVPDTRKFLTRASGTPYPVEKLAEETLDAVEDDVGVIVIPARARIAWRAYRWAPSLFESMGAGLLRDARATKPK